MQTGKKQTLQLFVFVLSEEENLLCSIASGKELRK